MMNKMKEKRLKFLSDAIKKTFYICLTLEHFYSAERLPNVTGIENVYGLQIGY